MSSKKHTIIRGLGTGILAAGLFLTACGEERVQPVADGPGARRTMSTGGESSDSGRQSNNTPGTAQPNTRPPSPPIE